MRWKLIILGFLWGTAVSIINYFYLKIVVKKTENSSPKDQWLAIVNCYIVRYFINIGVLLIALWVSHEIWAVATTGVGLTVMKNVMLVRELFRPGKRQGAKAPNKE